MARIDLIVGVKNAMAAGLANAKKALASFGKSVGNVLSGAASIAKNTAAAIGLIGGAAIAVGKRMVAQYQIQASAEAKLKATLEATGYAAGFTSEQLKKMASQLQKTTGVGDETILSMQGILATFKNVSGKQFEDATVAILDMGAAMGKAGKGSQDVESAVVQVGKALNDPIKGLSALSRVGVQFTEQQKSQIKAMQDAGNIAGAQNVILKELQTQFGGTSAAMAASTGGTMQLKAAYGDLQEEFGRVIQESRIFDNLIATLTASIQALIDSGKIDLWAEQARDAIGALLPFLDKVGAGIGKIGGAIQQGAAFAGAIAGGSSFSEAKKISKSTVNDLENEKQKRLEIIKAEREAARAARDEDEKRRMAIAQAEEKSRREQIKAIEEEQAAAMEAQQERIKGMEEEKKRKEEILRIGVKGLIDESKDKKAKEKADAKELRKAERLANNKRISGSLSKSDQEWLDAWDEVQKAKKEPSKNIRLDEMIKTAQAELLNMQKAFAEKIRDVKPINVEVDKVVKEQHKTNQLLTQNLRFG